MFSFLIRSILILPQTLSRKGSFLKRTLYEWKRNKRNCQNKDHSDCFIGFRHFYLYFFLVDCKKCLACSKYFTESSALKEVE